MKNIFSLKLYLQGLRKIRTAGVAMSIVIIVLNAWIPIQCITRNFVTPEHTTNVEAGMFAPFGFWIMFFAPLLVYNMFSYLNDRRGSDFFHSLPQKRICIYNSFMAAILTWIGAVLCVTSIINAILWAMADGYVLGLKAVMLTLLGFLILALVMAGFMALAMTVTGTAVANGLVFLLFFLFIRACGLFFLYGFSEITPMFNIKNSWLRLFDWEFFLPIGLLVQIFDGGEENFGNIWFFLYWITVAVALFAVSAVTYCRRKSESATKSAPNRFMQSLYRIGVTFPFLMMGVYLMILESDFYLFLLCVFIAFLVWIIFELMTTKKIKNVIRSLPLLLIPALMAAGYGASVYLARGIYYATTPDREEIESVQLDFNGMTTGSLDEAVIATTKIKDSEVIDKVYEAIGHAKESADWSRYKRQENGYIYNETITLTLKSGRKVTYTLCSPYNLYDILKCSEDVQSQNSFMYEGEVDDVSGHQGIGKGGVAVWEALREDYKNMTDEQKALYQLLNNQLTNNTFSIRIYAYYQGQRFTQRYLIDAKYTPTAMGLYMQYCSEPKDTLGCLQSVKDQIADIDENTVSYASVRIENYTYGKTLSLDSQNFKQIKEFLTYLSVDQHLTDYENAKNIYRVYIDVEYEFEDTEKDGMERSYEEEVKEGFFRYIHEDMYLTFSDEDIERFKQIVNYPIMPLSEN